MAVLDVGQDGVVFFGVGLEDLVVLVDPDHRTIGRYDYRLELIDFLKLVGFGVGRACHAPQLVIHPEVVLECDRGQGLVFVLDLDAFFGLDRLMQAVGPAPPCHEPPGKLVDDDHLIILHDVLLIAKEEVVGTQRHHQVMHQRNVSWLIQRLAFGQHARAHEDLLGLDETRFRHVDLLAFFVDPEIALGIGLLRLGFYCHALEQGRHCIHANVQVGVVFGLARNNQRRAGFVDQNGVDLIYNGEVQRALAAVLGRTMLSRK